MKHSFASLPLSNSFSALPDAFFSRVRPSPFEASPELIHFNPRAAELLDLDPALCRDPELPAVLTGRRPLPGAEPLAMLYAGHQFGHFVPQLGDGRAIVLGETTNRRGEKWEIQLKGSGLTPYSRDGDGRAVLRSTIREYLCSEAMHGLGVPTTRALCIVGANDEVYRERIETGAMLTRLAPSHVRFGSFEVFYYRQEYEHIGTLADWVIQHHYPELREASQPRLALLQAVVDRTARLMAQWQTVGFAHGVMNTDNMSILGLTLDYGPFGFMEAYDPGFVCNHSDHHGRYAFDRQPGIGLFNLSCLAQAMLPVVEMEAAKAALATYEDSLTEHYQTGLAAKLGFEQADDAVLELAGELLQQMQQSRADYTLTFRGLGRVRSDDDRPLPQLRDTFIDRERFDAWLSAYRTYLMGHARPDGQRRAAMDRVNPKYVLRNYMAQVAIEKAERERDYTEIDRLLNLLHAPFDEQPEMSEYARPAPDWAANIRVSCSS